MSGEAPETTPPDLPEAAHYSALSLSQFISELVQLPGRIAPHRESPPLRLIAHPYVEAGAAWASLSFVLDLRKSAEAIQEELSRPTVSNAALLSTSEDDNKLPTITSPSISGEVSPRFGPSAPYTIDLIEDLRTLLKAIELPIQQLIRVVEILLGVHHFYATGAAPPHATSPCGVIRLAAPLIPRAPGCDRPTPSTAENEALTA